MIGPVARAVVEALDGLALDKKQVQLDVKLNGQAGALIAKTGAEGRFQVALAWKAKSGGGGRL